VSDTAIYDRFAVLVTAFAAAQGIPCALPGRFFTAPSGADARWLELQWFPNRTEDYGLANDGPRLLQGFGQLSACYRPGLGIMVGTQLTDQIRAAFPKGLAIGPVKVHRPPWTSSVITDPQRIMHPVTIPWRGLVSG